MKGRRVAWLLSMVLAGIVIAAGLTLASAYRAADRCRAEGRDVVIMPMGDVLCGPPPEARSRG